MRKIQNQWDYEMSEPVQETYEEEEYVMSEEYGEVYDDEKSYDDYSMNYGDDLGDYGSDLNRYMKYGSDQDEKERVEGLMDSAFLLNETDKFSRRPDAELIRNNFRQYVKDSKSDNPVVKQVAHEGACRDLEFFIMSLITRSFRTYIEKDRSFYEDLMQAGRMGIMMALPKYDPDKSMPTTYFFNPIRHEMVLQVNMMKHDTKSHVATTKKKIQEVDKRFARYGRTPSLHDYVYNIKCPFHRIVIALAEIKAGNMKTSIDDPDAAPLADRQPSTLSPEESAISNINAGKIIRILYDIEPRKEIVDCFVDLYMGGKVKTSELAQRYGLSPSEVTEGIRNLGNLARYHPEIRKMYPEKFCMKEYELSERIAYMPAAERKMAMENVLDSLKAMSSKGEELDITFS